MRRHRLDRLARLTKGVALLGASAALIACNDDAKHVNSPAPEDTTHVNATEPEHTNAPAPSASAQPSSGPPTEPVHVNSPR